MAVIDQDLLPPASRIAVGYCPARQRSALTAVLALDHRLSQLVARTSEPMLGQMRLAWWREALQRPAAERPRGDVVLDALSDTWESQCEALIGMVDSWEHLLQPDPLDEHAALAFARGRATALVIACGWQEPDAAFASAMTAARVWAIADLAANVSHSEERALLIRLGLREASQRGRLNAKTRSLAVLGALGHRALLRGGRPLMEGRGAAIQIAKAAIILR
jgi:15-cis-phytoene synthase